MEEREMKGRVLGKLFSYACFCYYDVLGLVEG